MSKLDEVELVFYSRMMAKVREGGWLVSSSACSPQEIAWARAEGRMFTDQDGFGYVVRPAASMPAAPSGGVDR